MPVKIILDFSAGVRCTVRSQLGYRLEVAGDITTIEPTVNGDEPILRSPALIHNAWAYALNEKLAADATDDDTKKSHQRQAKGHRKTVENIAELIDLPTSSTRTAWCSACYSRSSHEKIHTTGLSVPVYLCTLCGSPTLPCAAPRCENMAVRDAGSLRVPRFCAEHRHEIPSFAGASAKVPTLEDYRNLHVFDKANLARMSRVAMTGVAVAGVAATAGLAAAPAIGGAIGAMSGFSGAAATSYGLALLGGGSVAAGGLGMVGGTYVIAAAGAALGGALGMSVTTAYIGEDKSFDIRKFKDGRGTPVIVARGFLTQKDLNWGNAMDTVRDRYPNSPIYQLCWGSKELKSLAKFAINNVGIHQGAGVVGGFAAKAGVKAAVKFAPIGPAMMAFGAAKNPWHTSVVRADRTGVALAGILARVRSPEFILVGHSLGARAMIAAAETLGTSNDAPKIVAVHLLGAAASKGQDYRPLSEAVTGTVHNYYSTNDKVLKFAYKTAQAGPTAVGLHGFGAPYSNIVDHDVTSLVTGHSAYFDNLALQHP